VTWDITFLSVEVVLREAKFERSLFANDKFLEKK